MLPRRKHPLIRNILKELKHNKSDEEFNFNYYYFNYYWLLYSQGKSNASWSP